MLMLHIWMEAQTVHSAPDEIDGLIRLIPVLLATVKICEMVCYSRHTGEVLYHSLLGYSERLD